MVEIAEKKHRRKYVNSLSVILALYMISVGLQSAFVPCFSCFVVGCGPSVLYNQTGSGDTLCSLVISIHYRDFEQ